MDRESARTRQYDSSLRDEQARHTRDRILEALVEVLADGPDVFTVPEVAERSGVSIGTVYRHFGDKKGLLDALIPYAAKRTRLDELPTPASTEELGDIIHMLFDRLDASESLIRAALASGAGRDVRMQASKERVGVFEETLRRLEPDLTDEQIGHLSRVAMILTTSDALLQMKSRLGLMADEAAQEVIWAIRTMIAGATS